MLKVHEPTSAEQLYFSLQPKLADKYDPDEYVVINPKTRKYFVGKTSVQAMKKARTYYPKGKLFLAQVGRVAGLMK